MLHIDDSVSKFYSTEQNFSLVVLLHIVSEWSTDSTWRELDIEMNFETKFEYIRPVWNMYLGGFNPETFSSSDFKGLTAYVDSLYSTYLVVLIRLSYDDSIYLVFENMTYD